MFASLIFRMADKTFSSKLFCFIMSAAHFTSLSEFTLKGSALILQFSMVENPNLLNSIKPDSATCKLASDEDTNSDIPTGLLV